MKLFSFNGKHTRKAVAAARVDFIKSLWKPLSDFLEEHQSNDIQADN